MCVCVSEAGIPAYITIAMLPVIVIKSLMDTSQKLFLDTVFS